MTPTEKRKPLTFVWDIALRKLKPGSFGYKKAKKIWKLARHLFPKSNALLPPASAGEPSYQEWIENIEPTTVSPLPQGSFQPLISILVPAYETPDKYAQPLIASVKAQTYQNWQLCLVDGSSSPERIEAIKTLAQTDPRITYQKLEKNLGISGNTNAALALAQGTYVAFLDHDDTLAPSALAEVVSVLAAHPETDLVYTDEDKLSDDGSVRSLPFFKPDWSPDLFLGVNYLAHFVVVRHALAEKVNGLRPGFDGAQDYDFLLRILDHHPTIRHIPKILYHWRMADGSTARAIQSKGYADDAGRRALAEYVQRHHIEADVLEIPERPTNYRLKYRTPGTPLVSIIIPFKDKPELLKGCVGSILEKTSYPNYELILVSNNSTDPELFSYLDELEKDTRVRRFTYDHPFNYSAVNNFGRKQAQGKVLLFLNNDTIVQHAEWLEELVGVALQPENGIVGAWLFYPDGRTQHAGVILGMHTMAAHVFRFRRPGEWTAYGLPDWPRDYLAVTGACMAMRAEVFDEVGGLNERFIVAGSDVTLGLNVTEHGYRNVFWPYARVTHLESVSVESYNKFPGDYDESLIHYRPYREKGDPYFNPNLDLMSEQVALRKIHAPA